MTTQYTVVQYLPNPLSGERINLGLIAWAEGRIACRFVRKWQRVYSFGREDTKFLRDFVGRVEEAASSILDIPGLVEEKLDEDKLKKIIGSWTSSIQFSEPKSSLKPPDELLNDMATIFLREPKRQVKRGRDKRTAATLAAKRILSVLQEVVGPDAQQLLKRNHPVRGKFAEYPFDVVGTNGAPFLAAQGLSFEISDTDSLRKDVESTAWWIDDVKMWDSKFPLAVVVIPPTNKSETYVRARKIFKGLDAAVKTEAEIGRWANSVVRGLPPDALTIK